MHSFYRGKTVAVTGGLGLIGSFLCEQLAEAGAKTILIDDESKGSWRYIEHLRPRVDYRRKDLAAPKQAIEALADCEYVFHLASRAYGVGFSQKNNFEMFRFNDLVNTNVLDGIACHRPRHALVVWGSGKQRRNYIHARDCDGAMMQLVENGYFERPVNIGREETVSVKDLVNRIAAIAGLEPDIVFDRSKPEGRFIKSADSKLLLAALGDDFIWRVGLQQGLKCMVDWYGLTFAKPQ